jgi:hypothetical protein
MRVLVALILLTITAPVFAQTSTAQARADGKTFGEVAGKGAEGLADTDAAAVANLDAYRGASAPESAYLGNPAGLDAAAITTSRTNEGSVLVIDGDAIRPKVPKSQIDETVATGDMINQTPDVYARGVDLCEGGDDHPCSEKRKRLKTVGLRCIATRSKTGLLRQPMAWVVVVIILEPPLGRHRAHIGQQTRDQYT